MLCLPLLTAGIQRIHDLKSKGSSLGIGMGLSCHIFDALIKTCVTQRNGGISAVEQLVDGFALFKTGQSAILPQNGSSIRKRTLQPLVTAQQCLMAQLHTLPEDFPELVHVPSGGQGDIGQIDGDNTLIEAAVILVLAGLIVAGIGDIAHTGIGKPVRGQEAAAAHADIDIALQFQHLLLGDIIRNHALGSTLGGQTGQIPVGSAFTHIILFQHINQLREGRGDPDTVLILDTFITLAQGLLDDHGKILLLLLGAGFVQVHEHGDEGSLTVGSHQGNYLILNGLDTAADFVTQAGLDHLGDCLLSRRDAKDLHFLFHSLADLLTAHLHKGSKVGQTDGLSAVLIGSHLCNDLCSNITGSGERMGLFDHGAGNDSAVLQHVVQIHQIAVVHMLGKIIGVVEMNNACIVGIHNRLGQQDTGSNVLADLAGHVVTLDSIDGGVLVGILLLDFLIVGLNQAQDAVVGGIALTGQRTGITVCYIILGNLKSTMGHNSLFH